MFYTPSTNFKIKYLCRLFPGNIKTLQTFDELQSPHPTPQLTVAVPVVCSQHGGNIEDKKRHSISIYLDSDCEMKDEVFIKFFQLSGFVC